MSRGHRFHHDKPVWISTPGDYVDALRGAKVLVDPDERRERIVREVERRGRAPAAARASTTASSRRSTAWSNGRRAIACSFEREFLRRAAGSADRDHGSQPEVLPGARRRRQAHRALHRHRQHRVEGRGRDPQGLRARDPAALRRRQVLLRRGPEAGPGVDARRPGDGHLPAQARHRRRQGARAWPRWPRRSPRRSASMPRRRAAPRSCRRPTCSRAWSASSRNCRASWAATTPRSRASRSRSPTRSTRPTCRASPAMRSRRRKLGQVLAIAERLDTLAGGFAAGLKPTGNKDPFALRRNALGLARTLIEGGARSGRCACCDRTHGRVALLAGRQRERVATASRTIRQPTDIDRASCSSACAATTPTGRAARSSTRSRAHAAPTTRCPTSTAACKAIGEFAKLPEAEALAAANKRIRNILRKAEGAMPDADRSGAVRRDRRARARRRGRQPPSPTPIRCWPSATTSPCSAAWRACARRSMRSSTA